MTRATVILIILVAFFSCKKEEKTYVPAETQLTVTVNGTAMDRPQVFNSEVRSTGSSNQCMIQIASTDSLMLFFPLKTGTTLSAAEGVTLYVKDDTSVYFSHGTAFLYLDRADDQMNCYSLSGHFTYEGFDGRFNRYDIEATFRNMPLKK